MTDAEFSEELKQYQIAEYCYMEEIARLREEIYEVVTNGEWTDGEQRGDWKISPEVYETARDALPFLIGGGNNA